MGLRRYSTGDARGFCLGAALALALAPAAADPIKHPTAVFAGLDKITGRIKNFDVAIDETVQFGTLLLTPRVCNSRPQTETPLTTTFVEVDEQAPKPDQRHDPGAATRDTKKYDVKRIFSGWMFAGSPGLHGVEHPVYDVWLVDCKGGKEVVAQPAPQDAQPATAATPAPAQDKPRSGRTRKIEPKAPTPPDAQGAGAAEEPVFGAEPGATPDAAPAPRPQKPRRERRRNAAPAPARAQPAAPPPAPAPQPQNHGPFGLF